MKFYFILFSLLLFLSCNKDDANDPSTEQVEILPTIPQKNNDNSLNTRALDNSNLIALDYNFNFVSRYYKWNNANDANHHYSLETPNNISNFKYIGNGFNRSFFGSNYSYEGISFYTSKYLERPLLNFYGDVELRSVYLPESNNTRLYTLESGKVDPYQNYSQKSHLGYIESTKSSSVIGLVPIKEYYSEKEKDYYYVSDDVTIYNMGNQSGNYTFSKIIGYAFQTYRVCPYYYNYFHISSSMTNFPSDFSKFGKVEMVLKFTSEVISESGSPSGQNVTLSSEPMHITAVNSYVVLTPPTRDVLSSELIIYYYDKYYQKQTLSLGDFYFSNNFPNGSDFSYVRNIGSCTIKINLRRNSANLWNIQVTGA